LGASRSVNFSFDVSMARFSIVVTTTDRPGLLPACVRAALAMDFDDFELIVSDNSSQIPAAEILADVHDSRLRIIRTDRRLALSDHWEFAWEHVRGDYVIYLGDDNSLHPKILAVADRTIRDHNLDILSWRVCSYFHPDWNIDYGPLPDRGNILGIDVGTTQQLYQCRGEDVLEHFCRNLRFSGCFPSMLSLFRTASANMIRKQMGRLFWAPCADVAFSYLMLGVSEPGAYAFLDAFGAIGGRSRHSNVASMLSRGNASRRAYDYVEEHRGQDMLPRHQPKFVAMSNLLAATISQAKALMPGYFSRYDFDPVILARKTIEDIYIERTVPWMDDPAFLAEVDQFFSSLPAPVAAEVFAYRDECRARMHEAAAAGPTATSYVRNFDEARASFHDFWRKADSESKRFASRLVRETRRNPIGRFWVSGVTTYVDMSLYGGQDIADAARSLPLMLAHFDRYGEAFADYYRKIGMLGEQLAAQPPTGGRLSLSSA
jgi:glycosyltransferase involved in cell wall biosynthesis